MTYLMNLENTSLQTDKQVKAAVEYLKNLGYDVAYTNAWGLVNPSTRCPATGAEWFAAITHAYETCPAREP